MTIKQLLTTTLLTASLLMPISSPAQGEAPFCVSKLGQFTVHETNKPRFGTPITTGPDGTVYITYIDPSLQTVIRQYNPRNKTWSTPTILAPKTTADAWHTQPSLGIDFNGHIHAAYNMHNTPWQYSISDKPHNTTTMTFKGQEAGTYPGAGTPGKADCTNECETHWLKNDPTIAAIPGNQITYPTFGNTQDGDLYIGNRECLYCDKSFYERQWSAGISRYDPNNKVWKRVADVKPWATEPDKVALGLKLTGDFTGRLHTTWLYCNKYTESEGGQACFAHPNFISYAVTSDNGNTWKNSQGVVLPLPLTSKNSEVIAGPDWFDDADAKGYYAGNTILTVDTTKKPFVVIFPNTTTSDKGIKRSYITLNAESEGDSWTAPKVLDYSPSLVYKDMQGRLIAVSGGLRIHISNDNGTTWQLYPLDLEQGSFTFTHDRLWLLRSGQLRLYAQSEENKLHIYSFTFTEGGTCQ